MTSTFFCCFNPAEGTLQNPHVPTGNVSRTGSENSILPSPVFSSKHVYEKHTPMTLIDHLWSSFHFHMNMKTVMRHPFWIILSLPISFDVSQATIFLRGSTGFATGASNASPAPSPSGPRWSDCAPPRCRGSESPYVHRPPSGSTVKDEIQNGIKMKKQAFFYGWYFLLSLYIIIIIITMIQYHYHKHSYY